MDNVAEINMEMQNKIHEIVGNLIGFMDEAITKEMSVHDVEKTLWLMTREVGRGVFQLFLDHSGDGDLGEKIILQDGRDIKRLAKQRTKEYLTVFGEFHIPHFVYGTREGQKIQYSPLEVKLQLPESKTSALLDDWNQSLVLNMPFSEVSNMLDKILGFKQSVHTLERMDQKMAEASDDFWEQHPAPPSEEEGEITVLTADGKGVSMRNGAKLPGGNDYTLPPDRSGVKKMALLGSVYTIDRHKRTPEELLESLFSKPHLTVVPRTDSTIPSKPTACHKEVRAALIRDEKGTTAPQTEFIFSSLAKMAERRGLMEKKECVILMDGQDSLWRAAAEHFPKQEFGSCEILDLLHASAYIWEAANLFYTPGSTKAKSYAKKLMKRILNSEVDGVIKTLKRKGKDAQLWSDQADRLMQICGYLSNNAKRMDYKYYLERGYPIASGVIEGACRCVVNDRMERSGMRWSMDGAQAMLNLRSIKLSELWDRFVEFRMQRELERLYGTEAANDQQILRMMA